jgi:simple sugar transport system ATP-binding protein
MFSTEQHPPTAAPEVNRAFLEVRNVHKRFAGVNALRGVSFAIDAGKIYHLLGENGCGKSTLIKIIAGAQPPSDGCIVIKGVEYAQIDPLTALKLGIETVYQDLSLLPNLSVAQNIALGTQLVSKNGRLLSVLDLDRIDQVAVNALRSVHLPTDETFLSTPVECLPIATRQLIAIARAIATDARLVIMDEPTTALTQKEVTNLISVVNKLCAEGVAIIFVTHKLDECYAIGGSVIVFRDGQLIAQGDINTYSKAELGRLMTGRDIPSHRLRQVRPSTQAVLTVSNLCRGVSFRDITFTLCAGEILGVTGLLDSGRNELALALGGICPATRGTIELNGIPLTLRKPIDAIEAGIGYVPEDRISEGLFLDKPIRDNIIVSSLKRVKNAFGLVSAEKAEQFALKIIEDLRVATPDIERPVQMLSGGNQQRVLIGRWLAINPSILILHGPTVGVGSKETIYDIVQAMSERGVSVILISDDLSELLQNCDRILLMKKGKLHASYESRELDETSLYTQLIS